MVKTIQPTRFCCSLLLVLPIVMFISTFHSNAQTVLQSVIGNTSGPGGWNFGPLYRSGGNTNLLNYSRHAYIYTAAELNIPSGSKIISVEWMKKDGATITGNNNFNVWISNTSSTSFPVSIAWGNLESSSTQVFNSSTYSVTGGAGTYIQAPFNDSFTYSGGSLQILTDWSKLGSASGAVPFFTLAATGKSIGIASTTPPTSSTLLQTALYGGSRPTIRITYVTVPSCSGIPNPGNTISTVTNICAGIPFTLSLQNAVPGSLVTYQWQSADNASFTLNLTNNIGFDASLTTTQISTKYYRCIVTCGAGPTSGTSTPILIPMSPSYGCYCTSRPISSSDEDIIKFSLGNLKNCSDCSSVAPGAGSLQNIYSNYQPLPAANIQVGATIPFSIEIAICGSGNYANTSAIFIDYNQNNSFSDPGELVYSSANAISGAHIEAGNITIPASTPTGLTGVRVINVEQNGSITSPCLIYSYGETEDYLVNFTSSSTCSGMPMPGNTIAEAQSSCVSFSNSYVLCSGSTINLSIQNIPTSTGITYQWYQGTSAIAGATSALYTTSPLTSNQSFYCNVTCSNSGLTASSTPINITMASFLQCYCSSMALSGSDEEINYFAFGSASNLSDCDTVASGAGSILNRYANYTNLGNFANVELGSSVPFTVGVIDCDVPPEPYYSFGTAIWIDFNHNGSFSDLGERVFVEPTALQGPRTISGSIAIPCTALTGQTRMRVSAVEGAAGNTLTACLMYTFGETEDYLINIVAPSNCSSPVPSPGNTLASVTLLCDSTEVVLSLQNKCLFNNYTYQWFKNSVAISGATNNTYTTPKIYANTTYQCAVMCGLNTALSAPITLIKPVVSDVTLSASSSTYCTPGGTPVTLTAIGSLNYSYNPNNFLSPNIGPVVSATPLSNTTYTVIGTDANGCTRSSTTMIQVVPCATNFGIKLFIEGYYIGGGFMSHTLLNQAVGTNLNVCDSIIVELRNSVAPYTIADSKKIVLNTNGTASFSFPSITNSYYIAIKHRNALETWSAIPINAGVGFYDFTTTAAKAFGSNMIEMEPNVWALYSGEIYKDENIDLIDFTLIENDISQFLFGYVSTDINGDGNVDLLDGIPVESSISNFIFGMYP